MLCMSRDHPPSSWLWLYHAFSGMETKYNDVKEELVYEPNSKRGGGHLVINEWVGSLSAARGSHLWVMMMLLVLS